MPTKKSVKKAVKAKKSSRKVVRKKLYLWVIILALLAGLAVIYAIFSNPVKILADTYSTNFENFNLGSANGQDSWTSFNPSDQEIVTQNTYSDFGAKSFRISNGVATVTGANKTFSRPLLNDAGETKADDLGVPAGLRQPHFEAEWDFASVTPNAEQPGLEIYARMDRGDDNGISMSQIIFNDTPEGLKVEVEGFNSATDTMPKLIVAQGLNRSIPHHIKVAIDFKDGPDNDIVTVCVDRDTAKCQTAKTYEGFYSILSMVPTTVRSVIFKPMSGVLPDTLGKGLYIDNFSSLSSGNEAPIPTLTLAPALSPTPTPDLVVGPKTKDECKKDGWQKFINPQFKNQGQCIKHVLKLKFKELENREGTQSDDLREKFEEK